LLETHPLSESHERAARNRAGPHAIRIEIWERGAGYTLASGSSVARPPPRRTARLCTGDVARHHAGRHARYRRSASDWSLTMLGPAAKVRTASSLRIFSRVRDARHATLAHAVQYG